MSSIGFRADIDVRSLRLFTCAQGTSPKGRRKSMAEAVFERDACGGQWRCATPTRHRRRARSKPRTRVRASKAVSAEPRETAWYAHTRSQALLRAAGSSAQSRELSLIQCCVKSRTAPSMDMDGYSGYGRHIWMGMLEEDLGSFRFRSLQGFFRLLFLPGGGTLTEEK